jgi:hypothetical protein
MYDRSLQFALNLPPAERGSFVDRLDKLRARAKHIGWGVENELNSLWHSVDFDSDQSD